MPEFLVKVADERGHVLEKMESGASEADLRDRFAQQGYLVYSVRPRGWSTGRIRLSRGGKVKLEQFVIFNEQFLTLIHAGLPILTGLELLIRRQRDPGLKALLQKVHERVRSGELLSQAFAEQGVFPKIYSTTLLAGERSGNLEEVLSRYVSFQRLGLAFRKKLAASLVYPALLGVALVCMLTFLMVYVVPRFAELYSQFNARLPAMTQVMLAIGVAIRSYFVVIVAVALLLALLLWHWSRTPDGADLLDHIRLKTPIGGEIWLKYQIAVFARMMATLLGGGLPLVPALETAAGSLNTRVISRGIRSALERVREGFPLSRSLEETGVFPDLAVEMVEVGETTGALPAMLASVAEFYEQDVENALAAAMSLIEPIILIIMGAVVAFVLISLYLPIFSLGASGSV